MSKREQTAVWLLTILGCLWLGAFPLFTGGSYAHITYDKWIAALVLGGVSTLLGLVSLTLLWHIDWKNPARLLALGYLCWISLSCLLGTGAALQNASGQLIVWIGSGRYEGLSTQLCYLAVFLALSLRRPRIRVVALTAGLALLAYAALVAVQYADLNPFGLFPAGRSILLNYEFQGTIGNIDMVSGYVLLVAPMLLCGWLLLRGPASWGMLTAGLAGVLLELLMEVQGGLIATAFMLLLMGLLALARPQVRARSLIVLGGVCVCLSLRLVLGLPWLDAVDALCLRPEPARLVPALLGLGLMLLARPVGRRPGKPVRPAHILCLLIAVCLLALALLAFAPIPSTAGGLWEIHEVLSGRAQDSYGSWRLGVWRHALHLFADSPVFGTGTDAFYPLIGPHLAAESAFLGENFDNPHNLYLAILCGSGAPALALYLAMLAAVVYRCLRRGDPAGLMLVSGVIAYAIQGFFSFSVCLVSPMFWAVLGMAAAPPVRKDDPLDVQL